MIAPADAALLSALPGLAFHATLILCRMGAAVMLLPGIGEAEIPATMRMALAVGLVFALLPVLSPGLPPLPEEVPALVALVAGEILTGIWIGLLSRFLAMAWRRRGRSSP